MASYEFNLYTALPLQAPKVPGFIHPWMWVYSRWHHGGISAHPTPTTVSNSMIFEKLLSIGKITGVLQVSQCHMCACARVLLTLSLSLGTHVPLSTLNSHVMVDKKLSVGIASQDKKRSRAHTTDNVRSPNYVEIPLSLPCRANTRNEPKCRDSFQRSVYLSTLLWIFLCVSVCVGWWGVVHKREDQWLYLNRYSFWTCTSGLNFIKA